MKNEKSKYSKLTMLLIVAIITLPVFVLGQDTISSISNIEFDVFFDKDTCIVVDDFNKANFPGLNLGVSYWKASETLPVDSRNNCFREDGVNPNGEVQQKCCPDNHVCGDDGICQFEIKTKCSDFITQDECENDVPANVAPDELESLIDPVKFPGGCADFVDTYGEKCSQYLECKCEWDTTDSKCKASDNHKVQKIEVNKKTIWDFDTLPTDIEDKCAATGTDTVTTGKCTFDFTYKGSCLDGDEFITRSWTAFYEPPAATSSDPLDYCQDGSEIIPCERVVRLKFFSTQNLIIAIIIIALIYWFVLRDKDHRKNNRP